MKTSFAPASAVKTPAKRPRPKTAAACAELTRMAQGLGADTKLPTVVELCDSLGLSLRVLTSALDELEERDVIYRVQGSGIYVSPRLHKGIALICDPAYFRDSSGSVFWDLIVQAAHQRADSKNEEFSLHFAAAPGQGALPLHDGLVQDLRSGKVQGVLCVGNLLETVTWLEGERVPHVAFAGPGRWMVQLDDLKTLALGVRELARQNQRKIGYWSALFSLPKKRSDELRRATFCQQLSEHGLAFEAALLEDQRDFVTDEDDSNLLSLQEQGYQTALKVFGRPRPTWPDGLLISNDLMTHGALVALNKLGVEVGRDVSIATQANRGAKVFLGDEDKLTLIEFDPAEVVQAMFEMLELLMNGQTPPQPHVLIAPHLKSLCI